MSIKSFQMLISTAFLFQYFAAIVLFSKYLNRMELITRLFVLLLEHKSSRKRSGTASRVLFLFWMTSAAYQLKQFYEESYSSSEVILLVYFPMGICLINGILKLTEQISSAGASTLVFPENGKVECPRRRSSLLSQLFFTWILELKFRKQKLAVSDLWALEDENRSRVLGSQFEEKFYQETSSSKPSSSPTLFTTISYLIWKPLFLVGILQILEQFLGFGATHLFKILIGLSLEENSNVSRGLGYLVCISITAVTKTILGNHGAYNVGITTLRVRSFIMNGIYSKSLRMANYRQNESSYGELVNMLTTDCIAFERFYSNIHLAWSIPFSILLSIWFQWQLLGSSVLAGVFIMLILMLLNVITGNKFKTVSESEIRNRSQRISLIQEMLSSIQEIKLYTLEDVFASRVGAIRTIEMNSILQSSLISAGLNFLWSFSPFLMSLATFLTYIWRDEANILDAQKVFVYLALMISMSGPLRTFPSVVSTLIQVRISFKRVQNFLRAEDDIPAISQSKSKLESDDAVLIQDGSYALSTFELKNINMEIKRGSLVAIIGKSGSGKTCLLSAMSKSPHVQQTSGVAQLNVESSVLLTQSPFILNDTIESNILFGLPMERAHYQRVVDSCALLHDFNLLQDGDQTRAGNKGSNLSGGQRQRIALARVLYRPSDIYFLDTPLSAVDKKVGQEIFLKAIGRNGIRQNKARVLTATSLDRLEEVDQIYVISSGQIIKSGTYSEICKWESQTDSAVIESALDARTLADENPSLQTSLQNQGAPLHSTQKVNESRGRKSVKKLLNPENDAVVVSHRKFLQYYLQKCGWVFALAIISLHICQEGFRMGSNNWLSKATATPPSDSQHQGSRRMNFTVYALLGIAQGFCQAAAAIFLTVGTLRAATSFHSMMVERSLRTRMEFYHKNSIASILVSFTRDIGEVDKMIGNRLMAWLSSAFSATSIILLVISHRPLFVAVVIPLTFCYILLLKYYRTKIIQLQTLDVLTHAPIYEQFNETLIGMETIRGLRAQETLAKKFQKLVDVNISSYFVGLVAIRFHSVCLDMLGHIFVFFTGFLLMYGEEGLKGGLVGLLLGYAFQITGALNSLIVVTATLEGGMAAVQRIEEYEDLPQEEVNTDEHLNPVHEDIKGEITFKQFGTKYSEALDVVLEGVTATIHPSEKIGIVGRTGSGKSSLMLSLVRILEAESGSIEIDGLDIARVRIQNLREMVTVVSQDPVIFSGTLRFNLDPVGRLDTRAIWEALEKVSLKLFVESLPNGLDSKLVPSDPTLSLGQKQLLSFARGLLRNSRILIFDEATAAMDEETEDAIGRLIKSEFPGRTLLIIAHRLQFIMGSSRVMVIRNKTISEFGTVASFLGNPSSDFYQMVHSTSGNKNKIK